MQLGTYCLFLIVESHIEAETMNSYEQRKGSSQPPNQDRVESKVQVTQGTHEKCGVACASIRHKESVTQQLNDIKSLQVRGSDNW